MTSSAWTCDANGLPEHTTASVVLRGTRTQERTRSTTNELGLSWEETEVAAVDEWRRSEAMCVHMDVG